MKVCFDKRPLSKLAIDLLAFGALLPFFLLAVAQATTPFAGVHAGQGGGLQTLVWPFGAATLAELYRRVAARIKYLHGTGWWVLTLLAFIVLAWMLMVLSNRVEGATWEKQLRLIKASSIALSITFALAVLYLWPSGQVLSLIASHWISAVIVWVVLGLILMISSGDVHLSTDWPRDKIQVFAIATSIGTRALAVPFEQLTERMQREYAIEYSWMISLGLIILGFAGVVLVLALQ